MMTEIALNNTYNNAVAPPTKPAAEDDLELSETFHDEESFDDDIQVTKRRSSDGGESSDESGVRRGGILRTRAALWSLSTLVMVTLVIIVVVVTRSSSSSSNANSHGVSDAVVDDVSHEDIMPPTTHHNGNSIRTKSPTSDATDAPLDEDAFDFTDIDMIEDQEDLRITLGCLTDRFDNHHNPDNNRLYPGQYICSNDDDQRYRFGVTLSGDVVFEDVQEQSLQKIYENPHRPGNVENATHYLKNNFHFYMTLTTEGALIMHRVHAATDENGKKKVTHLWTAEPQQGAGEYLQNATIGLVEKCLPTHDCPHLHLQKGGNMDLNWVDDSQIDSWQAKNFMKVYGF